MLILHLLIGNNTINEILDLKTVSIKGINQSKNVDFCRFLYVSSYITYFQLTSTVQFPKYLALMAVMQIRMDNKIRTYYYEYGVNIWKSPYFPEQAPWNEEVTNINAIDPDHCGKRWIDHVVVRGIKETSVDPKAWRILAASDDVDYFGWWWYDRDTQNVPDCKLAISENVERELEKRGFHGEAKFCHVQEYYLRNLLI